MLGDTDAARTLTAVLEESFVSHRAAAEALARRILGDAALAEDAVQVAFTQILVRLRDGDPGLLQSNPRAVVLHGTRWAALKLAERSRDRHAAAPLDVALPAAPDAWDRVDARLVSAGIVAALPPHYRDALVLRYLEDQPDERAAARLALTVKAYRRRLDRARAQARVLAAREEGRGALLTAAPLRLRGWQCRLDARVRQIRARLAHLLGGPGFSHWAMFAALAGLSISAVAPPAGRPHEAGSERAVAAVSEVHPASVETRPPAAPGGAPVLLGPRHPGQPSSEGPPKPSPSPGLMSLLTPPPPEATAIVAVTPAPQYERTHTVVMVGFDNGVCNCVYAYRSEDGGATWAAFPMPATTTSLGVTLPPTYPDDPRVLVNNGYMTPPCMLASLDSPLCVPLPLVGIAAFGAHFDSGDPVVYGLAGEEVSPSSFVAYNVDTHVMRPLIRNLSYNETQVVTPSTDRGPDVFLAYFGEDPRNGAVGNELASRPRSYVVDACDTDLTCTVTTVDGMGGSPVETDVDDPTAGVLVGVHSSAGQLPAITFALTADQGRTYPVEVTIDTGKQTGQFDYEAAGAGTRAALYIQYRVGTGPESFERHGLDGSVEALSLPPTPVPEFLLVTPLTSQRLIAYDYGASYPSFWCSTDGGHTWAVSRCPAER